jgi:hypothetical protein
LCFQRQAEGEPVQPAVESGLVELCVLGQGRGCRGAEQYGIQLRAVASQQAQ